MGWCKPSGQRKASTFPYSKTEVLYNFLFYHTSPWLEEPVEEFGVDLDLFRSICDKVIKVQFGDYGPAFKYPSLENRKDGKRMQQAEHLRINPLVCQVLDSAINTLSVPPKSKGCLMHEERRRNRRRRRFWRYNVCREGGRGKIAIYSPQNARKSSPIGLPPLSSLMVRKKAGKAIKGNLCFNLTEWRLLRQLLEKGLK